MNYKMILVLLITLIGFSSHAQVILNNHFSEIEADRTRILKLQGEPNTFVDFFLPSRSEEQAEIHLWESGNFDIGTSSFNDGGKLFLRTLGNRRMVIDDLGRVGIGTEHPQTKLFLEGGKFGISNNGHDWYQNVTPPADFLLSTPFDTVMTISQQNGDMQLHGDYNFAITRGKLIFKSHAYNLFPGVIILGNGKHDWELYPRIDRGPDACWENNTGTGGPFEPPVHDFFFNVDGIEVAKICQHTGNYTVLSDSTAKKEITPIKDVLTAVQKLRPVSYYYKKDKLNRDKTLGFIAQEVDQVFPELIEKMGDKIGLNYDEFAAISIKAIQEQQFLIKTLFSANEELKSEISQFKTRMAKMENRIEGETKIHVVSADQ